MKLLKRCPVLCSSLWMIVFVCLFPHLTQAAEGTLPTAGLAASNNSTSAPVPGFTGAPILGSAPVIPSPSPSIATPSAPLPESLAKPRTTRKNGPPVVKANGTIEFAEDEGNKIKNKIVRQEKAEDQARNEALDIVRGQQVDALREDRSKEMPYLDRMYIKTSITPLMVQKKEEFLSDGAKDLNALILRARSVHTQAKAAHENIALYNRRMLAAFRKLFPEASLSLNDRSGAQDANSFDGSASPYTGKDWKVSLRQPLFSGGVLWNTFLQEKANVEAAKKQYDKTLAELVFDLSRAYFEYQRTLQTSDENRSVVEKMKRFSEMSEEKYKEKIISEIEYLNVQSLYSKMQFDLESANQELEIAKLDMQKYLDLSSHDEITIAKIYDLNDVVQGQAVPAGGATTGPRAMPDVFKGEEKAPEMTKLIDLSYGHRPELQVESAKLQATRLAERVRWGEFLPKAFLTYDFGELGDAYRPITASGMQNGIAYDSPVLKKQWQLMLEMNWNLGGNKVNYTDNRDYRAPNLSAYASGTKTFTRKNSVEIGVLDGLDAFVGVKQAEVDKLNQVVELEKAEKQVIQDVKQAYYDYQKALIQVNSKVKRLEYQKRKRDYSEYRLSKKEIEISEYMNDESELVTEKAELHRALKDYFTAKAALNHAVGIQDFLNVGTPRAKAA